MARPPVNGHPSLQSSISSLAWDVHRRAWGLVSPATFVCRRKPKTSYWIKKRTVLEVRNVLIEISTIDRSDTTLILFSNRSEILLFRKSSQSYCKNTVYLKRTCRRNHGSRHVEALWVGWMYQSGAQESGLSKERGTPSPPCFLIEMRGHLHGNLEKMGVGSELVWGSTFYDNVLNHSAHIIETILRE